MGGVTSLGDFLDDVNTRVPGSVWRIDEPLSVRHEITALQYGLERLDRRPILVVENPVLDGGRRSPIPVVTNLMASRRLAAEVLGVDDHRDAAAQLAARMATPIEPDSIEREHAPVAEVWHGRDDVDVRDLPALVQHALDPGPYLSAAHATTWDPDSGIDNTAIQRGWVEKPNRLRFYPYPSSHNWANIRKWWDRGEDCPIAFWIGAHPALDVGANQKLAYPESHWSRAGGLIGSAVRLTPTHSFGSSLMVPADAEIVIEGVVPRNVFLAEGPFGEYTGYAGAQRPSPVVEVHGMSHRRESLFHDYGSGLPDMLVPDNLMLEAALWEAVVGRVPSLDAIHVPSSGKRFHCYVRLREPRPGEATETIEAVLANRRIKHVVVVDEDIDVFDEGQVLWAIATRVQWTRDVVSRSGAECSILDPSLARGTTLSDKAGIDATLPAAVRPGLPRPTPPVNTVPEVIDPVALVRRLATGRLDGFLSE